MSNASDIPVIGISMGDPLGIGPEVVVKALADPELHEQARFIVYGRNELLTLAADRAGIRPYWYRVAHESERAQGELLPPVTVIDFDETEFHPPRDAKPDRTAGHLSKAFVEEAIADALRPTGDTRRTDAIVTAPICKESWSMAGFRWPGHTELLAHRTRAKRQAMAFVSPRLRVVLASAHVPLMDVKNVLTIGRIHEAIEFGHELCRDLGVEQPRIAVCGLNPHAGENGVLGDEDGRVHVGIVDDFLDHAARRLAHEIVDLRCRGQWLDGRRRPQGHCGCQLAAHHQADTHPSVAIPRCAGAAKYHTEA